jgi:hypothetical protein
MGGCTRYRQGPEAFTGDLRLFAMDFIFASSKDWYDTEAFPKLRFLEKPL